MKKIIAFSAMAIVVLAVCVVVAIEAKGEDKQMSHANLFINASKNRDGNTARLAKDYFDGQPYKQVNLVDYDIKQLGQNSEPDDFEKVRSEIESAKNIVIGTPVYWSDMTGLLKTFIDRHETVDTRYDGKNVKIIVQGSGPTEGEIAAISHVLEHWTERFSMEYKGVIK